MDFYVFDNINTFNERIKFSGNPLNRLDVLQAYVTQSGAFWYYTNAQFEEASIDLKKRYVHIHPGIMNMSTAQFDKKPFKLTKTNVKYNPKSRCIEVMDSVLPWKKPFFKKQVIYYGTKIPARKISALGSWYCDLQKKCIYFVLDYFPDKQRIGFHFEEEIETPTREQYRRVSQLEKQISELESNLSKTSS